MFTQETFEVYCKY
jgi:arginyl-tRNA--protein-N-Asp/Glu arginylyltransferase